MSRNLLSGLDDVDLAQHLIAEFHDDIRERIGLAFTCSQTLARASVSAEPCFLVARSAIALGLRLGNVSSVDISLRRFCYAKA